MKEQKALPAPEVSRVFVRDEMVEIMRRPGWPAEGMRRIWREERISEGSGTHRDFVGYPASPPIHQKDAAIEEEE